MMEEAAALRRARAQQELELQQRRTQEELLRRQEGGQGYHADVGLEGSRVDDSSSFSAAGLGGQEVAVVADSVEVVRPPSPPVMHAPLEASPAAVLPHTEPPSTVPPEQPESISATEPASTAAPTESAAAAAAPMAAAEPVRPRATVSEDVGVEPLFEASKKAWAAHAHFQDFEGRTPMPSSPASTSQWLLPSNPIPVPSPRSPAAAVERGGRLASTGRALLRGSPPPSLRRTPGRPTRSGIHAIF